jgi:hypothetical protein
VGRRIGLDRLDRARERMESPDLVVRHLREDGVGERGVGVLPVAADPPAHGALEPRRGPRADAAAPFGCEPVTWCA